MTVVEKVGEVGGDKMCLSVNALHKGYTAGRGGEKVYFSTDKICLIHFAPHKKGVNYDNI